MIGWLKEMAYCTRNQKHNGDVICRNINQVQLPGGLTMNGDRILNDAQEELMTIKNRFAMDFADPPRDAVG